MESEKDLSKNYKPKAPFLKLLKPSELSSSLKEFEGMSDKIIRTESAEKFTSVFDSQNLTEAVSNSDKLFKELQEKFGVAVVPAQRIISKNENGQIVVFTITQRINGENLSEIKLDSNCVEQAKKDFDAFLLSLLEYAIKKYSQGGYYLSDIFSSDQYIYVKEKGGKSKICLVDLDTKIGKYKEVFSQSTDISRCLSGIFRMIRILEEKLGERLETTEKKFLDFINSLPPDDPNYKELAPLKNWFC